MRTLMKFTYPTVERLAVVYRDGSVSVSPDLADETLPAVIEICTLHNQTASPSNLARVARVRVEVVEFIDPPAPGAHCPTCGKGA